MKIFVAQFQTVSDLDDLRDSVRDADLAFITCIPHLVSRDRDDLLARVMTDLRAYYDAAIDADDDDLPSSAIQLIVADADPDLSYTYDVNLADEYYACVHVTVYDL